MKTKSCIKVENGKQGKRSFRISPILRSYSGKYAGTREQDNKPVSVMDEKDWRGVIDYPEGNGSRDVSKMANVFEENSGEVCSIVAIFTSYFLVE